jgi:hypothetical protein
VLKQIWILVRDKVRDKDFTYFAKVSSWLWVVCKGKCGSWSRKIKFVASGKNSSAGLSADAHLARMIRRFPASRQV